jgi:hypothetical protein
MSTFDVPEPTPPSPWPSMADWEFKPGVTEGLLFCTWADQAHIDRRYSKLPMWHAGERCYPAWTTADTTHHPDDHEQGWPALDPHLVLHLDLISSLWLAELTREATGQPRQMQFCQKCVCRRRKADYSPAPSTQGETP